MEIMDEYTLNKIRKFWGNEEVSKNLNQVKEFMQWEITEIIDRERKTESKADKMFEKLGYEKEEGTFYVSYTIDNKEIIFYKTIHMIKGNGLGTVECINMEHLEAINEKCKELGWIK